MADLADELLRDLEGDDGEVGSYSDEEPGSPAADNVAASSGTRGKRKADDDEDGENGMKADNSDDDVPAGYVKQEEVEMAIPEGGVRPAEELDAEDVAQMQLRNVKDVKSVARLSGTKTFKEVLQKVAEYSSKPATDITSAESPEYKLIVQANNMAVEIDNEVLVVQKFVRDNYAIRFPELETLVDNPYDYIKAAKAIGNPPELEDIANTLKGILPAAQVMVVTVEATTTRGKQMSPDEWKAIEGACEMSFELEDARKKILEYVESRIRFLAPNLCAIVGSRTATKLLGIAGGLNGLSKMPSANIYLLGAQHKAPGAFHTSARIGTSRHTGFIYQSELVQACPAEIRLKAQRTVGAKCTLACRMDQQRAYPDGSYGQKLSEELEKKLERLAEPPPAKITKALPVPVEGSKKRRGGKRARKAKEAYAMTELRKLQNRMAFGEEEEETGAFDETRGLGMAGSSSGKLRQLSGESRSKAKMSKSNKNRLAQLKGSSSGTQSGLASSISFTPHQGVEFVDPTRQKRVQSANDSWFAEGAFSVVNKPIGTGSMIPAIKKPQ